MFKTVLETLVNPSHELCLFGKQIDWDSMEIEFAPLYGTTGRPSVPIRTMVGLLLLKQIYNLGDVTVMERWVEIPYWQHFCGEIYFQYKAPFDPSDFVHFRKRIGKEGMESIFKQSIILFGEEKLQKATKEVRIDTTVQEKNITFPTDRKLYAKVLDHCRKVARVEGIWFKRTYARQIKNLQYQLRFATKPKNHKKQAKFQEKYRRIVVRLCDDLIDQLSEEQYMKQQQKARQRSRAGIEALISQLKTDHSMLRNYLSGVDGDRINTLLAATAYNMKKWMRWKRQELILSFLWLFFRVTPQEYSFMHLSVPCKKGCC
jgi:transposase, IS5 family